MDAMRAVSPVPIRFDEIKGEAKGYYDSGNKEIVIQSGMSEVQTMKTAAHELAHARLHDRDSMREQGIMKDQKTREIEAEACAHVLLSHYHLDSSGYTIPYLASWCGSQDTSALRASMDTIRKTAAEIFDEVEAYVAERDVDRYTIYQIDKDTPAKEYSFMRLDHARKTGIPLAMEYYRDVYHGYLRPGDTLDSLYEKFNRDDRPAANQMHSLSMSDVIVLRQGGKDKAYYVDDVGFAEIPEFLIPVQEQEQGHDRGQKSLTEARQRRKKRRKNGKLPLKGRDSVLDRLKRYQEKLRRKKQRLTRPADSCKGISFMTGRETVRGYRFLPVFWCVKYVLEIWQQSGHRHCVLIAM